MRRAMRALATVVAVVALLATAGVAMAHLSPTPGGGTEADAAALEALDGDTTSSTVGPVAADAIPPGCTTVIVTPPTSPDHREADLCVPEGPHRDVAVILVHGGGGFGGSRSDMGGWAQVYNYNGYVTLSVDYLVFGQTTRSPVYPEPEQDVKASVQWVRDHADELGVELDRRLEQPLGVQLVEHRFVVGCFVVEGIVVGSVAVGFW